MLAVTVKQILMQLCLRSFVTLSIYSALLLYRDSRDTWQLNQESWSCVLQVDFTSETVSLHIPLHRTLSAILVKLVLLPWDQGKDGFLSGLDFTYTEEEVWPATAMSDCYFYTSLYVESNPSRKCVWLASGSYIASSWVPNWRSSTKSFTKVFLLAFLVLLCDVSCFFSWSGQGYLTIMSYPSYWLDTQVLRLMEHPLSISFWMAQVFLWSWLEVGCGSWDKGERPPKSI